MRRLFLFALAGTFFVLGSGDSNSLAGGAKAGKRLNRAAERFELLVEAGRHDEAKSLVESLAKRHGDALLVRLMQRHIELLDGIDEPADDAASEPRPWRKRADSRAAKPQGTENTEPIAVVYPVADLVIPVPGTVSLGIDVTETNTGIGVDRAETPTPDFDQLIELVTSTIAPHGWASVGGENSIKPMETTLSLVIRAPQSVHEEIAGLFRQLRRLQDFQVTLEIRHVVVADSHFERIGVDFDVRTTEDGQRIVPVACPSELKRGGETQLGPAGVERLIGGIQSDVSGTVLAAPKITLFNGQTARLSVGPDFSHLFRAVVSDDRRSIRVLVARDAEDTRSVLASARHATLPDGHTLLVDGGTIEREVIVGHPVVRKVPYVSRLFKNTGTRQTFRRLMLVTARVIVQEEEEELLPVSMATPPGIVPAEEEPLLGLDDPIGD